MIFWTAETKVMARMINPEDFKTAIEAGLSSEHWQDDDMKTIWKAMLEAKAAGLPHDIVPLDSILGNWGRQDLQDALLEIVTSEKGFEFRLSVTDFFWILENTFCRASVNDAL